jgi:hypothetical protein
MPHASNCFDTSFPPFPPALQYQVCLGNPQLANGKFAVAPPFPYGHRACQSGGFDAVLRGEVCKAT